MGIIRLSQTVGLGLGMGPMEPPRLGTCLATGDDEYSGGSIAPHNLYPFVPSSPGSKTRRTVVLERDSLFMSDIPQMRREFSRLRRDDLLMLGFLDLYQRLGGRDYHETSLRGRRVLAEALRGIGLDVRDPLSVRRFLSKALRFHAFRYPEEGSPEDTLLALIACMRAGLIHLQLDERTAGAPFVDSNEDLSAITAYIKGRNATFPFTDIERLAEGMLFVRNIFYEDRPLFYREDQILPALCVFRGGQRPALPEDFLSGPSRFIEAQGNLQEGADFRRALEFFYLNETPYDTSRIKRFTLGGIPVVSKRVEPLRVRSIEEEIRKARIIRETLTAKEVQSCRTVEFIGLIYDQANFYLLMKDECCPSLRDNLDVRGDRVWQRVKEALSGGEHLDLEMRNATWNGKELALCDFEGPATTAGLEAIPPGGRALAFARMSLVDSRPALKGLRLRGDYSRSPVYRRFDSALSLSGGVRGGASGLPTIAAIGDVHGNHERLVSILESPVVRCADRTVFIGDYFDRDRGGRSVFNTLKGRPDGDNIFLLGNHDLYLLLALGGDKASFDTWMAYGGLEFLDTVLDLSEFKGQFLEVGRPSEEDQPSDIIERIRESRPDVLDGLLEKVRGDGFLRDVWQWLLEKGRLFHIDEYGTLYIHAGIRCLDGADIGYFDRLQAEEKTFKASLTRRGPRSLKKALSSAGNFRHHLEIRESDWLVPFLQGGHEKVFERLSGLGIRGVVYGHSQHVGTGNTVNRLFNIDLSMAMYYGGHGGVLEVGPAGIALHFFAGHEASALQTRTLVDGDTFKDSVASDARVLMRGFREFFMAGNET